MALHEIIKVENGKLSFGNHELDTKEKMDNFEVEGDIYKLKTFKQLTKLERNGRLLYDSVPGTSVTDFVLSETSLEFCVNGKEDAQLTIELESDQEYKVFSDDMLLGKMKTNLAGKITLSADFHNGPQKISIKKVN